MVTTVRIDFHIFININMPRILHSLKVLHSLKGGLYFTILPKDKEDVKEKVERAVENAAKKSRAKKKLSSQPLFKDRQRDALSNESYLPDQQLIAFSIRDIREKYSVLLKQLKLKQLLPDLMPYILVTKNMNMGGETGAYIARYKDGTDCYLGPLELGKEKGTRHMQIFCDTPEELHLAVFDTVPLDIPGKPLVRRAEAFMEIKITKKKKLVAQATCKLDWLSKYVDKKKALEILKDIYIQFDCGTSVQAACFNEFVKNGTRFTFDPQPGIMVCISDADGSNVITINKRGTAEVVCANFANMQADKFFDQISSNVPSGPYVGTDDYIDRSKGCLSNMLSRIVRDSWGKYSSAPTKTKFLDALDAIHTNKGAGDNNNDVLYCQRCIEELRNNIHLKEVAEFFASFLIDVIGDMLVSSTKLDNGDGTEEVIKMLAEAICVETERIQSILSAKEVKSYKQAEELRDLATENATKESLESVFCNSGKEEKVEILQDGTKIATMHLKGTSVTNVELDPKHKEKIPDKLSIQVSEGIAVKIKDAEYYNSNINIKISDDSKKKLDKPLIYLQYLHINSADERVLAIRESDLLELDDDDFLDLNKVRLKINIENKDGTRCDDVFVYNEDRRVYTTYGEIFNYPNILSASPQITCIGAGFLKISGMQGQGSEKRVIELTKSALSSLLSSSTNSTFELLFDLGVDNSTIKLQIVYNQNEEKIQVSCSHTIVQEEWESILESENMKNISIKTDTDLTLGEVCLGRRDTDLTLSEVCRRAKRRDSEQNPNMSLVEVTNSVGIQGDNSIALVSIK